MLEERRSPGEAPIEQAQEETETTEEIHAEVVLVEDTSIEAMEEVIIEASSPPMDQVISPPTEPVDQTPAATQEFARVDCSVLRAIRREGVPSTNWNVAVLQQSSILC